MTGIRPRIVCDANNASYKEKGRSRSMLVFNDGCDTVSMSRAAKEAC